MAYTGKKPVDHTDVTQSQSMTVTDDLTVDTSTLKVDSTNNRVGIGTASPATALDVSGTVTADGLELSGTTVNLTLFETDATDLNTRFRQTGGDIFVQTIVDDSSSAKSRLRVDHATGDISFYEDTGTDVKMFWDASAEALGIGTTTPTGLLELKGTTPTIRINDERSIVWSGGEEMGVIEFYSSDGSGINPSVVSFIKTIQTAASTSVQTDLTFGTSVYNTAVAERFRITSGGSIYQALGNKYIGIDQPSGGSYASGERSQVIYAGSADDNLQLSARNVADASSVFASKTGANIRILFTAAGNGYWDGAADLGSADYAEYFEWDDGNTNNEDRAGYSVVLTNGNKIRKATSSDAAADIIGVVSGRPAVVGDSASFAWHGKWDTDDFARRNQTDITVYSWTDDEGEHHEYRHDDIPDGVTIPDDAVSVVRQEDAISSDYDDTQDYTPREERQEWSPIGMLGKLRLRVGQPTGDRWIKMRDIATDDDGNVTVEEWLVR